ncbi:hypothetical protein [Aerococcus kribbianus]|uniref:Uncharacterized protein n=1 Tax=Aerococcus kribbianus TaxID=2999064 RepID=A0A9X3FRU0_9LACT|nr:MULTISPECIES: hypothetical protein [unclassified Aerococcus]MCZ0717227.1 hypothetical protein [Aerococcus sp. YH-aer221]MCZ0725515.1 hypothetical protein [Aerococcus sp. YH-aer222]
MRWSAVYELFKVNMYDAYAQHLSNTRKKNVKKTTDKYIPVMKNVWFSQLITIIASLFLAFLMATQAGQLKGYPGLYSNFMVVMALFMFVSIAQSFSNLVLDANDREEYFPLPFTQQEIFTSKLLSMVMVIIPFQIAIWATMVFLGDNLIYGLLVGFLLSTIFILFISALLLLILNFLFKIPFVQQHRKAVMIGFYAVGGIAWFALYMRLILWNSRHIGMGVVVPDMPTLPISVSFYHVLVTPQAIGHWLVILAVLAFTIASLIYVSGHFGQNLNQESGNQENSVVKTAEIGTGRDINHLLFKYNFKQIKDPSLAGQILLNEVLVVVIGSFSLVPIARQERLFADMTWEYFGLFLIIGFFLPMIMQVYLSFSRVIISVDKENYNFMASLPITRKDYLLNKFKTGFLIDFVIAIFLVVILMAIMLVPPLLILVSILGVILGVAFVAFVNLKGDYRDLKLDWSNLEDLMFRHGKLGMVIKQIVVILGLFLLILAISLSYLAPVAPLVLSSLYGFAIILFMGIFYFLSVRPFWNKL